MNCRRLVQWVLFAIVGIGFNGNVQAIPTFREVKNEFLSSDALLLDRHGATLQHLRVNPNERKLTWVSLEDISPAMRIALIASEDKRFYEHAGVDWSAVAAAAWGNLWHSRTRGASTITMQLAGLLNENLHRRSGTRTTLQKINQAIIAQWLERSWRKDQILEAYLNLVPFRGELVGVHALSRVLFDKHPSGLDQVESALAVALIRAPNAPPARVASRACQILQSQNHKELCQNLDGQASLYFARLSGKHLPMTDHANGIASVSANLAPHLARRLLTSGVKSVTSTVDAGVQSFARDSLVRQLSGLVDRNVEDGAVLVLDNASGDVLAWVGSSGNLSDAAQVDGVLALRQAGSTLKPFLYELALEKRWLTAASILDDSPVNLSTGNGLYIPQNYDKHFKGLVSVRTALGSSLNIPAVRTLVTVTPERFFQRLQKLGFQLRESGDYYGYSLALGSADVSLLALTNAYRSLANHGAYSTVRFSRAEKLPLKRNVMDSDATYIIGDILSDRAARSLTFGLENVLATRFWSAVKTGTSKDMRDNWCIGYSARYTVGVWVGNASGAPMWDVSGITGAAPVWQEVMQYLYKRDSGHVEPIAMVPVKIERRKISYEGQLEAARNELFLPGTAQTYLALAKSDNIQPAILYPKSGMIVALDPDIPPERQRIRFDANAKGNVMLVLDGHLINHPHGSKSPALKELMHDWSPWPGKHVLSLLDAGGKLLDQVHFEVRGAYVAADLRKAAMNTDLRKPLQQR